MQVQGQLVSQAWTATLTSCYMRHAACMDILGLTAVISSPHGCITPTADLYAAHRKLERMGALE